MKYIKILILLQTYIEFNIINSKIFNKKLVLGNGLFSILLPLIASSIIPALILKKGKGVYNKNNFFCRNKK